jgi:hypothetical protein
LTDATSGSAGSPDDALNALEAALETAGKAAIAQSAGDPAVIAAVKLGWLVEELTRGWSLKPQPGELNLSIEESSQAQADRLTMQLAALKIAALTTETPAVKHMVTALQTGPSTDRARPLAAAVVVALVGAGARYESAYVLGQGMRAMIPNAGDPAGPTKAMISALDILSSDLPSHAARGVANSIRTWQQSNDHAKTSLADAQVDLWRAVIVGEKRGTELLEPEDYLKAAGQLERKYVERALHSGWLQSIAGAAILLFALGVVALVLASNTGTVAAGISGVLASLGLTWKGIGGTVGRIVGKLEAPLWGAELDTAITDAITLATDPTDRTAAPTLSYADRRARVLDTEASPQQLSGGQDTQLSVRSGTATSA